MYPQDNRNFVDFRTTMPAQYGTQPTYIPTAQPTVYPKYYIPGHIVNTIAEVVPNDVPMNGTISVFPTSDGQTIFTKAWNADGTISTVRYDRAADEATPQQLQEDPIKLIMDKLEAIESKLNYRPRNTKQNDGGQNAN